MRKIKRISKFLLFCLFISYFQFLPITIPSSFAQEFTEAEEACVPEQVDQTCAVITEKGRCSVGRRECLANETWDECQQVYFPKSEICDNSLDDDCDGIEDTQDPDCQTTDLELKSPIVEIYAENGVLKYKLLNEDDYLGLDIAQQVEWFEKVQLENGTYNKVALSSENEYRPQNSGTFAMSFTIRIQTEQGELNSSVEDEFIANFPVIDQTQFENLNYRAGERFTLKYFDNSKAIINLVGKIQDKDIVIKKVDDTDFWEFEGTEITKSGEYDLWLKAESTGGFEAEFKTVFTVLPNEVNAVSSKLEVLQKGSGVEYVPIDSETLDVRFTAYDEYLNGINVSNLDRVDIRFNGQLLEGTDLIGPNVFVVERRIAVPKSEILDAVVTVDVFDAECDGNLFINNQKVENYCFGKTKDLIIYDSYVYPVESLEYSEKTREKNVVVKGIKKAGYGVKINSVDAGFEIEPDENTTFSITVPLAEGLNSVKIYAVKAINEDLIFYSKPAEIVIEKDTKINSPKWNNPAITLDGENQATLHWTDPVYLTESDFDFSHVNIYRSTVPNFVPSAENLVVQTHNPSWTDTGLIAGVNYYYLIEAVDDVGNTAMIEKTQSSGKIKGNLETVTNDDNWYDNLFAGKGIYEEENGNNNVLSGESNGDLESDANGQEDENVIEDGQGIENQEQEESKLNNLFKTIGDKASTVYNKLSKNIFVQICCGGVLIFLALMILISVLVWLKEKLTEKSSIANLAPEIEKSDKSKKRRNKSKKKKKK